MTSLGRQVFVTTILATHPRKTKMQIAALQIPIDYIGDIGPPETIARRIEILPLHLQLFKVILNAAKIAAGLRISGLVDADIEMLGGRLSRPYCVPHLKLQDRPCSTTGLSSGVKPSSVSAAQSARRPWGIDMPLCSIHMKTQTAAWCWFALTAVAQGNVKPNEAGVRQAKNA